MTMIRIPNYPHTERRFTSLQTILCLLCGMLLLSSCDNKAINATLTQDKECPIGDYLPISEGKSWIYSTVTTDLNGQQTTTKDTLTVQKLSMIRGQKAYILFQQGYFSLPDSTQINLKSDTFLPLSELHTCGCDAWSLPLLRCTPSDQWAQDDTLRATINVSWTNALQELTILSIYNSTVALSTQGVTTIKGTDRRFKTYTYTVRFHEEYIPDTITSPKSTPKEVKFSIQFVQGVGITAIEGVGFKKTLLDYSN